MDQKETGAEGKTTSEPQYREYPESLPRFSISEKLSQKPSEVCPYGHLNTSIYPIVGGWTINEQRALRRIIKRHVAAAAIMSFLIGFILGWILWGSSHRTTIIDGTPTPVAYMQTKHLESTLVTIR